MAAPADDGGSVTQPSVGAMGPTPVSRLGGYDEPFSTMSSPMGVVRDGELT
jgi:hypothetical protein